jgi:hypothetical protein
LDFWRTDDYLQVHLRQGIAMHLFSHLGGAISAGSVAAPVATSVSSTAPSTGTTSEMVPPSTSAPINTRYMGPAPRGFDYYSRKAALLQHTHLLLHWLLVA